MTDGGMYYTESGDEFKKFSTRDGRGIIQLRKARFPVGIISSGFAKNIIEKRAEVLGVQLVSVGASDKVDVLKQWCKQLGVFLENVADIGDDVNDIAIINEVGFSACPADAYPAVAKIVNVVLTKNGGDGCVREFVDRFLSHEI